MKRALLSVSDKTGIVEFATGLVSNGYEIIATGNTKRIIDEAGIKTISVEDVTGFPEMLDGRVKTLHPLIHGALLGVRDNEEHVRQMKEHEIVNIDLVCVNLYPFKETILKPDCSFELAIENIDIGGPSMLRSAAKNFKFVTVVTDVNDYDMILDEISKNGDTTLETRSALAAKVFRLTAAYDTLIQDYLTKNITDDYQEKISLSYDLKQVLRYGENPHQSAAFYTEYKEYAYSLASAEQLHGKELSYNNIQDANATLQMLREFKGTPCVVAVKHMNPSGVGIGENLMEAWIKAYNSDSVSIFGGLIATNQTVTADVAELMSKIFLEVIMAPGYTDEAYEMLSKKKNIRLLTIKTEGLDPKQKIVSVTGGILVQDEDMKNAAVEDLKFVTEVKPENQGLIDDMLFGEKVCKHVKSNAIILVKDGATVGIGAGQMNRVGAAKIALEQAGEKAKGSVLISDAFFPFDDTVTVAGEYGVHAILQPGGSIRDEDSIKKCNEMKIAMAFTGLRHFKH